MNQLLERPVWENASGDAWPRSMTLRTALDIPAMDGYMRILDPIQSWDDSTSPFERMGLVFIIHLGCVQAITGRSALNQTEAMRRMKKLVDQLKARTRRDPVGQELPNDNEGLNDANGVLEEADFSMTDAIDSFMAEAESESNLQQSRPNKAVGIPSAVSVDRRPVTIKAIKVVRSQPPKGPFPIQDPKSARPIQDPPIRTPSPTKSTMPGLPPPGVHLTPSGRVFWVNGVPGSNTKAPQLAGPSRLSTRATTAALSRPAQSSAGKNKHGKRARSNSVDELPGGDMEQAAPVKKVPKLVEGNKGPAKTPAAKPLPPMEVPPTKASAKAKKAPKAHSEDMEALERRMEAAYRADNLGFTSVSKADRHSFACHC